MRCAAIISCVCVLALLPGIKCLAEGERPLEFSIDVIEGVNDNRDGSSTKKESNFETRIVPAAACKIYSDRLDFDFHYSPQLILRSNPGDYAKDTELYHDLGLGAVHRWSERLALNASEGFALSDVPANMNSGQTFHEFVTYWINRVTLGATYEILPERAAVTVRGSHLMKEYQEDAYAKVGNEKNIGGGISSRYMLRSGWTVLGDVSYDAADLGELSSGRSRKADVVFCGVGLERVFGLFSARVKGGADIGSSELSSVAGSNVTDSATEPGGDAEVAYTSESGSSRMDLSVGYHTIRSDIAPFATQQRTSLAANVEHSFSELIRLRLDGVYAMGEYSRVDGVAGGSDAVAGLTTTLTYAWNQNLNLEARYRFENWTADENIRESYHRNVVELAMKAKF